MKVGVINYGVGNLGSVVRALEEIRVAPKLIDRAIDIHSVDCLILPGVGNFSDCANLLRSGGWIDALNQEVRAYDRPILGICVGMQLLADTSTEVSDSQDIVRGLGFIPGRVEHLRDLGCELRTPHVVWNGVVSCDKKDHLFDGIPDDTDFYFVHSYAFVPEDHKSIIATVDYSVPVAAAVRSGRIWGTQFHPEKSSRAGFRLLRNFIEGPDC
jgi:glutamine amidotransferase